MKAFPSFLAVPLLCAPLLVPQIAVALDTVPVASAKAVAPTVLPLREVVLFSSGVGYFGRAGRVNGDAAVDLTIRAPQLADILKSLVLLDPSGELQPITYSIDDWLQRRPRETDLRVDSSASPGSLLRGFQGAVVRLQKENGIVEGRVVSVSAKQVKVGDSFTTVEVVTLFTDNGLATVRLDDVTNFRLVDAALDAKLRASLEKLALGMTAKLDDGTRTVSLRFTGKGARDVRAGYLLETPVWKTSYRLVLDDKAKPYLQGWAVVENTSDEDWNGVRMTLVSGRPVSFLQEMAAPIYIGRPVVPPSVQGSAQPQTYGAGYGFTTKFGQGLIYDSPDEAMDQVRSRSEAGALGPAGPQSSAKSPARLTITPGILHRSGTANYSYSDGYGLAESVNRANIGNGEALAQGMQRGELFAYALDGLLSLPRAKAALVPILAGDIAGDAVTIVASNGQSIGELAPMNGFALKNSMKAHLQGGPITVYSDGIYAGDALISSVSPGETRLLSFASDLDLLARLDKVETNSRLLTLSAANGNLVAKYGYQRVRSFVLKNKSAKAKIVVVQIPDENGYKLSDPKQLGEKSADGLRFRVPVAPSAQRDYDIRSETTGEQQFIISSMNFDQLTGFMKETAVSTAMKAALQEILARRARLTTLSAQRTAQQAALQEMTADQSRIRDNMSRLNEQNDLYKSYVAKLTAQEPRFEALRNDIERLRAAEVKTQQELSDFVNALEVK